MQTEDEMTINERRKYLKRMKPLYLKAKKSERGRILDEMQQVTGLHRKSLSRLFHAKTLDRHPRQKQREPRYGKEPEFFNAHLVRFWKEKVIGVHLSRSRPYHKNDNRFVEQKNESLVCQYFGTLRLETAEQCQQMNELYELMWRYYNLFQPVLHLVEKTMREGKLHRRWDQAQTPYARRKSDGPASARAARAIGRLVPANQSAPAARDNL